VSTTPLQLALAERWRQDAGQRPVPAWLRERQQRALAAARSAPWPDRHQEAWKYTSMHALGQRAQAPGAGDAHPAAPADLPGPGLVFVDGELATARRDGLPDGVALQSLGQALAGDDEAVRFAIGREPEQGDVFQSLNAAFAIDGAWLQVAAGAGDSRWLTVQGLGALDSGRDWHLAHRIEVGAGARLRLHLDLAGADAAVLATVMTRIRIQRDGHLELAMTSARHERLARVARTRIELEQGARLDLHLLDGGAAPSRHDLEVVLRGERSRAELGGVFLLDGRRHADTRLELRHEAGHADSQTTWRAIADGRSRAVFTGRIAVAPGADGTDARLGCKSLLGSAQAEVDATPVLEILADDVKCAHGATVGQLDPDAMFYLRSRGLDAVAARSLLTRAFAVEALAGSDDSPARALLRQWLGAEAA
jgi:Fe-S cluster assembly protein SufD